MANITEWMNNKTVLITGGAGFFGKVLIEKILRSCPGIKKIFLIIRSKGGIHPKERWSTITKDKLFEKLLVENTDIMDRKVVVLNGDMSLVNFGLPEGTLMELKNSVNVIFHSAATVRFNDPLHKAFLANTRGTLEMCKLASKMKNLECFVHVSTTYCNHNLNKNYYEEKIYEPCQDWKTVLKLIETEKPETINTISYKIIQNHPNTYTFTKSLSEKIVEEYSSQFPAVIARPSVVVGIYKDPLPGWTDNLNGPTGVTTGVCKGIIRIVKGKKTCSLDYVAVDIAINALIICAWDKARSEHKELSVYNCAYKDVMTIDFEGITNIGLALNKKITLDNNIWYSFLWFATNDFYFHLLFYLLHLIPALFLDLVLLLLKKKPLLMKINIKIYQALQALAAFTIKEITFDNKNFKELWNRMAAEDIEVFYVKAPDHISLEDVMKVLHIGIKVHYLKEKLEDNEYHRLKQRRFYYLDRFVRVVVICGFLKLSCQLIQIIVSWCLL